MRIVDFRSARSFNQQEKTFLSPELIRVKFSSASSALEGANDIVEAKTAEVCNIRRDMEDSGI